MYFLLIEAAGVRQAGRIHPDWYAKFNDDIDSLMKEIGFRRALHDGDLFLFEDTATEIREPETVVLAVRTILDALHFHGESILEYTVVLDYRDHERAAAVFGTMVRLLRFARVQNSAYVTETVCTALDSMAEFVPSGGLFRIVAFQHETGIVDNEYHAALIDKDVRRIMAERIETAPGNFWITGPDVSVLAAAARQFLEEPSFFVSCAAMERAGTERILHEIVRRVSTYLEAHGTDNAVGDHLEGTVDQLRVRFIQPGCFFTSSRWLAGELVFTLRRLLYRIVGPEGAVPLFVLDGLDDCEETVLQTVLDTLTTPEGNTAPSRVVVVSRKELPVSLVQGKARWNTFSVGSYAEPVYYERAHRFWAHLDGGEAEASEFTEVLKKSLSHKHLLTLYILRRLSAMLPPHMVDEFFSEAGINLAERTRIIKDLVKAGLLTDPTFPQLHRLIVPVILRLVSEEIRHSTEELIGAFLIHKLRDHSIVVSGDVWDVLRTQSSDGEKNFAFHDLVQHIAAGGSFTQFHRYTTADMLMTPNMELSTAAGRIRLHLRDSRGPESCEESVQTIHRFLEESSVSPEIEGDLHLALGEYHLAQRDYSAALNEAKRAVLLQQNDDDAGNLHPRIARVHLLMARIMFAQRRLSDAGRYLGFATEESGNDEETFLVARSMEAVRLFLVGNMSRSLSTLEDQLDPLLIGGYTDWLVLLWFLRGRIHFELGDYREAVVHFGLLRDYAESCGISDPHTVARTWEIRSALAAHGATDQLREELSRLPESPEVLFITAELYTREGRFSDAAPLLEEACNREEESNRWPRMGVCWDNGFAAIEDMMIANTQGSSELSRVARAFYAWTLAHIDRYDEAVAIFYALTRGSEGSQLDPYTGLYNYLYSTVLPEERSGDRDDRTTVLGRSVKLIQERTSRIEDYRDKLRFLKDNVWNEQLMTVARRHNLV